MRRFLKYVLTAVVAVLLTLSLSACFGLLPRETTPEPSSTPPVTTRPETVKPDPLVIKETGYTVVKNAYSTYVSCGLIVTNPNDVNVSLPQIKVVVRDADNKILSSQSSYVRAVAANDTVGVGLKIHISSGEPATVEFTAEPIADYMASNDTAVIRSTEVEFTNVHYLSESYTSKITGEILNKSSIDAAYCDLSVLFRDADNKLIGGDSGYLSSLPSKTTTAFEVSVYNIPDGAKTYDISVFASE
jgi:hypothetical protein